MKKPASCPSLAVVRSDGHRSPTGRFLWITPMVRLEAERPPGTAAYVGEGPFDPVPNLCEHGNGRRRILQINPSQAATALLATLAAGVLDEDTPHGLGGRTKDVAPGLLSLLTWVHKLGWVLVA